MDGQQKEVLPVNILDIPEHVGAKKILLLLKLFCSFVMLGEIWLQFSRYSQDIYRMGTPNNFTYFTLIEWVPQTTLLSQKFFWNSSKTIVLIQNKTVHSFDNTPPWDNLAHPKTILGLPSQPAS